LDAGQRLKEPKEPMSAAATAAGYLYASGRLRGRGSREDEAQEPEQKARPARKALKVAGLRSGRARAGAARGAEKDTEDRVPHPALEARMSARRGGLYVGGFAVEKASMSCSRRSSSIRALAWRSSPRRERGGLRRRMQRCAYLVVPGLSYDTEPHALVMAFAEAVPVIASRLPLFAELVEPGATACSSIRARQASSRGALPGPRRSRKKCAKWGNAPRQITGLGLSHTGTGGAFTASAGARRAYIPRTLRQESGTAPVPEEAA
jgi:hypothetical protein